MKKWELTGEAFDRFLDWLAPDREQAARKYEAIRRRLIIFFDCRCCADSEGLTDKTINRVIRRISTDHIPSGEDPTPLFYAVAHYVHLDYLETNAKRDGGELPENARNPLQLEDEEEKEMRHRCLDRCLQKLAPSKRELIIQYYQEDKQAKIDHHKSLARQFGFTVNALRIQLYRLRRELHECIIACLEIEAAQIK